MVWRTRVAATEERLAFLEGTVGEHSHMLNGIRDAMTSLENRMDRRFEQIDRRFEQLEHRMDARFAQVDVRFAQMDTRFVQMEARFSQVDQRFESLDAKMSRHFVWLVGILGSGLVAMLGALAAAIMSGQ
jgi:uncharacterized coiled-coil protein SlyX